MFIKNVIISGFRSYREQSFPEGLSTGTNVIVGKNGSGKSNFFGAIQFVLNEKFANLRAAERKELFHVGSGRPSLSIFVELVFDNSDGRLVIPGKSDEPEVRIRRTVGLKQDEFRVNDRKFSAAEVHQLLESAGFSSSNPYYIVEQGKIVNLVNMSEEQRYQVIKDVAGTQVYEDRKKESEKILADTEVKQKQIDVSIVELEKRLKELESELTELKEFQEVDQEKRCFEYCIFNSELENAKENLINIEKTRKSALSILNQNQDAVQASENEINSIKEKIDELKSDLLRFEKERNDVEANIAALNSRQAVAELDANEATGRQSRNEKEEQQLKKEHEKISAALEKARVDAENIAKKFDLFQKDAASIFAVVNEEETRLQKLQERRSRTKIFKNKSDRDKWLQNEVKNNELAIEKAKDEIKSARAEISDIDRRVEKENGSDEQRVTNDESFEKAQKDREKKLNGAFERRDNLNHERRKLWQAVHDQESVVKRLEDVHTGAKRQMEHLCRHDIRQGLQSLKEILSELGDAKVSSQVYGPLIDLISVEDGYEVAVDVTAGNTLFNVVVGSFEISAFLLEQMNKRRKPGRISFFPLDTCNGIARNFATTAESSSLLSKIKYDQKFKGVVSEVLGRALVVSSLEAGAKLCKEMDCDVVTVEGDQLGKKGAITGGYLDRKNIKLVAFKKEINARLELEKERKTLNSLCDKVASIEQSITNILNEIDELHNQNVSVENTKDAVIRENRQKEELINRLKTQKSNILAAIGTQERAIKEAETTIKNLKLEMKEEFNASWTEENEKELEKLNASLATKRASSAAAQTEALRLGTEKQLLQDTCAHLTRRKQMIEDRVRELGWLRRDMGVTRENVALKGEVALINERLSVILKTIEEKSKQLSEYESKLETIETKKTSAAINLEERKDAIDRMEVQRKLLMQRRDDALQKLRKLGIVPKGVDKYSKFSIGKLMHHLKLANEKANKFSHVNKKALDQHSSLAETRNDLVSQRDVLKKERDSIFELIDHLDRQKDEAIQRTYKQIQYQFEEVFKELVGIEDCVAELQLVKHAESNVNKKEDLFSAARIRVSFGMGNAINDLEQLSGGQKSLVALALIFAIQRCDPAPFYLFDEIDAALDAEYRTSIARMIQKQSENCQFLIASFKTEILTVADKVLGIFFHNKVSRVQEISKEEGVLLLKQAAEEERKRPREALDS